MESRFDYNHCRGAAAVGGAGRVALGPGPKPLPGPNPPSQFTCFLAQDLHGAVKVGAGGFGEVYKAYHRLWRIPVAVKYVNLERSNNHELLEEAKKMYKAQFEYILRFYGIIEHDLMIQTGSLGLVTEFMENGSLEKLLSRCKVTWPLHLRFAYEIALGMNFLHNLKPALYHHDLKPANILLNKDYRIKICDFGLAKWRKFTSQNRNDSSKNHGTLRYMPPECFKDINARKDSKFDVYSYGIVIWEILTCQEPYKNAVNSEHLTLCVGNGDRPNMKEIPEDLLKPCGKLIKLMQQCWLDNPDDRPPFSKCVHDLEPEQMCEQKIRQAVQELAQQISSCVDGLCELNIGGHVRDSSDLCVPVEEQNECAQLVEPIQESAWKESTPEVKQNGSQEEIIESPSSVVTSNECQELAKLVNGEWKFLARRLDLSDVQIETIQYDHRENGLVEIVYQMLYTWKQHQGLRASRAVLARCLTQVGKEDLWKKLWS